MGGGQIWAVDRGRFRDCASSRSVSRRFYAASKAWPRDAAASQQQRNSNVSKAWRRDAASPICCGCLQLMDWVRPVRWDRYESGFGVVLVVV
jgi:hypothetical protein